MTKNNQKTGGEESVPERRSRIFSPEAMRAATLAGVVVLTFLGYMNWAETRRINKSLGDFDSRLTQLASRVEQGANRAAAPARQGPDPNRVYTLKTDGAPFKGPKDAPVTIVVFSEFQWPFCKKVGPTLEQIQQVYGDRVRIVWKHLPLDMHKDAPLAAVASMAAHEQGKFWEYHDKLFANMPKIQREFLAQYAQELGLDMKRFEEALNAGRGKAAIDADMAEAKSLGVTGTPGFFVNGKFLSGAKPFEEFSKVINAELARLNLPVPPAAAKPAD